MRSDPSLSTTGLPDTSSGGSAPVPGAGQEAGERPKRQDIDVFGLSHPGKVRTENQDHFLVASLHKVMSVQQSSLPSELVKDTVSGARGWLVLVADGVGGSPGGKDASVAALMALTRYVTNTVDLYQQVDPANEAAFVEQLRRSVDRTHQAVIAEGEHDWGRRGMATTLTLVMFVWPRAYLVHVGDSRCYRVRQGKLEQLTRDQTMAQAMLEAGLLTPDQAEASRLKHVLWSAVGGKEAVPDVRVADHEWDDLMLLCTDGLTKHVTDDEIRDILLASPSSEATCRTLVELALARGGSDNVSVVVGRLRPRGRPSNPS